jgi:hypothetical protein
VARFETGRRQDIISPAWLRIFLGFLVCRDRDEAVFSCFEIVLKRTAGLIRTFDNGDTIMLLLILNAIYSQFLQAALPGISSKLVKP